MTAEVEARADAGSGRGLMNLDGESRHGREAMRDDSVGPQWLAHALTVLILAAFVVTAIVGIQATGFGFSAVPYLLLLAILIVVGWLLAWKRPGHPLGWLLLAVPGFFCSGPPVDLVGQAVLATAPDAAAWLLWYGHDREDTWAWIPPVWLLLSQIPLRFPDGRLPSRRWRWFSRFTVLTLVLTTCVFATVSVEVFPGVANPIHVGDSDVGQLLTFACFATMLASFGGSALSLFVRYRRADAVKAAQLRWVFFAVAFAVGVLILSWVPGWEAVQSWILLGYALIPVAVVVAVLRYRLYDIDRIISRTASYAIVTLVVVGTYALVVVGITAVLPSLPSVAVALATLAAAALFLPVLRGVQRIVDRRFDRARYDQAKVVDAFGERLRNGADPHTAAADLGAAVEATLQPTALGLWIADSGESLDVRRA